MILIPIVVEHNFFCFLIPEATLAVTLFAIYSHISIYLGPVFLPLIAVTLASVVLYKLFRGKLTISNIPINKYIFLFIMVILFSLLFTQDWRRAIYDLSSFLKSLILFFLIVNIVEGENVVIRLIKAIVVAVLFGSIIALYEFQSAVRISLFSGRTGSVLADANFFASMVVSILPLSVYLLKTEKGLVSKIFWGFSSAIMFVSIVPTFSRGGMLGLAFILFLLVIHERRNKWTWILIPLLILAFVVVVPFDFWLRASTIVNSGSNFSIAHRIELLKTGVKVFTEHPIVGVGIGDFIHSVRQEMTHPMVAHNMYLHVFAETGIIGGILFLCILGNVLFGVHKTRNTHELGAYLEISLIGLFITALFISIHFHFWIWALLGISSAFLKEVLWDKAR